MPKIITPDSFDHWLQLKGADISSTEVSALFGISPYSTEFQLWHQKKAFIDSGDVHTIDDNERMYVGRNVEDTIAKMAAEKLGIKVRRLKTYMRHDKVNGMGSSFDYEIVSHKKGAGLLEIKNVDSLIYRREWEEDEAPPHIEAQLQHQFEVANRNWGIICALVGGNTLVFIERERDRKVGKAICSKIEKFWSSVLGDVQPDPDYRLDADFIIDLYNNDDGDPLDISDNVSIYSLVVAYRELRNKYNELDTATKAIKAEVFHRVGSAPQLFTKDGLKVTMTKTKDTPPTTVTEDMVGTEIGGRQGYRQFRVNNKG